MKLFGLVQHWLSRKYDLNRPSLYALGLDLGCANAA